MISDSNISLSQLNTLIGEAIAMHLERSYWLVAEVVELRENYSGHCYLSLAEKDGDKVVAQSKASIWQQTYRMVKPYFESATGQALAAGVSVRIKVSVSYHKLYGMNLTVQDIDPSYTVGEMTVRRQQILRQLEEDGVADMNKELPLMTLPQRVAIISSPTAAGYEDFINQLAHNSFGYHFETRLFAAIMQGEGAEASVIAAMDEIFAEIDAFDVVVLIRGGGAAIDLSCFDNYNIAYYLTQFPLPVLVGIGHERDETVLDLVANRAFKTPTAVASFLVEKAQAVDGQVENVIDRLQTAVHQITVREKQHIYAITSSLPMLAGRIFSQKQIQLNQMSHLAETRSKGLVADHIKYVDQVADRLKNATQNIFLKQKQKLDGAAMVADLSDPKHILKKGYSITLKDGKVLKDVASLAPGDKIDTVLDGGQVSSVVE